MYRGKKIACVIPARLGSTRLPRKMLAILKGKPLIQWVYEAAKRVSFFDECIVAVDHEETKAIVELFGGRAYLTSPACENGTERMSEIQGRGLIQADIWVNWQGDEPFIKPDMIEDLLQTCDQDQCGIWTLCKKTSDASSPNVPKVVRDLEGHALYFSRSLIPYFRDDPKEKIYYKHIGIYAFSDTVLRKISLLTPSFLERAEKLEQLRFLEHGFKIKVNETSHEIFGIDTPEDLDKAQLLLGD